MSTYVPTDWVDGTTPVNAANLDKMEQGIADAHSAVAALDTRLDAEEAQPDIPPVQNGKWLSGAGGALVWADPPAGGSSIEYENVWAAGTPYTPGDVVKHNGIDYLAVNPSTGQTPPPYQAPSNVLPIPLVTALPASPFDGQEVILVDSLTLPTYQWRLRYVAAITDANKWLYVGGRPAYRSGSLVALVNTGTLIQTGWYFPPGLSVTVPRAGDYLVQGFVTIDDNGDGNFAYAVGFAGGATGTATQEYPLSTGTSRTIPVIAVIQAAAGALMGVGAASGAGLKKFAGLHSFVLTPVRLA